MSRLDSFIRRLEAQRRCLNHAASAVRAVPGTVLELGLGNGRTFDHLRHLLPGRALFVSDAEPLAPAGSWNDWALAGAPRPPSRGPRRFGRVPRWGSSRGRWAH